MFMLDSCKELFMLGTGEVVSWYLLILDITVSRKCSSISCVCFLFYWILYHTLLSYGNRVLTIFEVDYIDFLDQCFYNGIWILVMGFYLTWFSNSWLIDAVFNQKTLYNAYKKRTKNIDIDLEEYNKMKEEDPEFYREASSLQYGKVCIVYFCWHNHCVSWWSEINEAVASYSWYFVSLLLCRLQIFLKTKLIEWLRSSKIEMRSVELSVGGGNSVKKRILTLSMIVTSTSTRKLNGHLGNIPWRSRTIWKGELLCPTKVTRNLCSRNQILRLFTFLLLLSFLELISTCRKWFFEGKFYRTIEYSKNSWTFVWEDGQ